MLPERTQSRESQVLWEFWDKILSCFGKCSAQIRDGTRWRFGRQKRTDHYFLEPPGGRGKGRCEVQSSFLERS